MSIKEIGKVALFIIICEMVGILGSAFTFSAIPSWYVYLNKPFFSPPNWVFGPVWTLLYAMMGVAAYLIYSKGWKNMNVKKALGAFAIQLFLNGIWTPIFFGLKNLGLAYVVIVMMWVAIVATMYLFYKIRPIATYLLIPYILWVSFASILNLAIWWLN